MSFVRFPSIDVVVPIGPDPNYAVTRFQSEFIPPNPKVKSFVMISATTFRFSTNAGQILTPTVTADQALAAVRSDDSVVFLHKDSEITDCVRLLDGFCESDRQADPRWHAWEPNEVWGLTKAALTWKTMYLDPYFWLNEEYRTFSSGVFRPLGTRENLFKFLDELRVPRACDPGCPLFAAQAKFRVADGIVILPMPVRNAQGLRGDPRVITRVCVQSWSPGTDDVEIRDNPDDLASGATEKLKLEGDAVDVDVDIDGE